MRFRGWVVALGLVHLAGASEALLCPFPEAVGLVLEDESEGEELLAQFGVHGKQGSRSPRSPATHREEPSQRAGNGGSHRSWGMGSDPVVFFEFLEGLGFGFGEGGAVEVDDPAVTVAPDTGAPLLVLLDAQEGGTETTVLVGAGAPDRALGGVHDGVLVVGGKLEADGDLGVAHGVCPPDL